MALIGRIASIFKKTPSAGKPYITQSEAGGVSNSGKFNVVPNTGSILQNTPTTRTYGGGSGGGSSGGSSSGGTGTTSTPAQTSTQNKPSVSQENVQKVTNASPNREFTFSGAVVQYSPEGKIEETTYYAQGQKLGKVVGSGENAYYDPTFDKNFKASLGFEGGKQVVNLSNTGLEITNYDFVEGGERSYSILEAPTATDRSFSNVFGIGSDIDKGIQSLKTKSSRGKNIFLSEAGLYGLGVASTAVGFAGIVFNPIGFGKGLFGKGKEIITDPVGSFSSGVSSLGTSIKTEPSLFAGKITGYVLLDKGLGAVGKVSGRAFGSAKVKVVEKIEDVKLSRALKNSFVEKPKGFRGTPLSSSFNEGIVVFEKGAKYGDEFNIARNTKPSRLGLAKLNQAMRIDKATQNVLKSSGESISKKAIRDAFKDFKQSANYEALKRFRKAEAINKPIKPIEFDVDLSAIRNQFNKFKSGQDFLTYKDGDIGIGSLTKRVRKKPRGKPLIDNPPVEFKISLDPEYYPKLNNKGTSQLQKGGQQQLLVKPKLETKLKSEFKPKFKTKLSLKQEGLSQAQSSMQLERNFLKQISKQMGKYSFKLSPGLALLQKPLQKTRQKQIFMQMPLQNIAVKQAFSPRQLSMNAFVPALRQSQAQKSGLRLSQAFVYPKIQSQKLFFPDFNFDNGLRRKKTGDRIFLRTPSFGAALKFDLGLKSQKYSKALEETGLVERAFTKRIRLPVSFMGNISFGIKKKKSKQRWF